VELGAVVELADEVLWAAQAGSTPAATAAATAVTNRRERTGQP
jgi:hypothetical protein